MAKERALDAARQLERTGFERLVIFSSLSKRSNVPGMRTGFVAGDPAIIKPYLLYRTYHGCALPVLVGSGLTPANLASFAHAHGFIVGSSVKHGGHWANPLDPDAVRAIAAAFAALPRV